MESNYQVTTQMRNKFALHMFHVKLPIDFIDKINAYVDDTLIPLDDNYGKGERRTLSANFRVPFGASAKDESSGDLHFKNMFDKDSKTQPEPEVTADTPMSDIL